MTESSPTAVRDHGDHVLVLSTGDVRLPHHGARPAPAARGQDQPYRPPQGDAALRAAVVEQAGGTAAGFHANQVVITPGTRQAVFLTLLSTVEGERREVLLPAPYWASYPSLVRFAGGDPVVVRPRDGRAFPTSDELDQVVSSRTAVLVVNSPRNPDGAVITGEQLTELVGWSARRGVTLLFDQVYRGVALTDRLTPTVTDQHAELPSHVVLVDGVAKSHAQAGLRLGWAVAGGDRCDGLVAIASHLIGHVSGVVQEIGLHLLRDGEADRRALGAALRDNLDLAVAGLAGLPGVSCDRPTGGIFVFPDLRGWLDTAAPAAASENLTGWLRDEHGVAVVDGTSFGAPGHVRLSFALPADDLRSGLDRLRGALT